MITKVRQVKTFNNSVSRLIWMKRSRIAWACFETYIDGAHVTKKNKEELSSEKNKILLWCGYQRQEIREIFEENQNY